MMQLDEKPVLHLVETEGLSSVFLDRDPMFQSLMNQIRSWNSKVMNYRLGKVFRGGVFICNFQLNNIPQALFY